MVTLTSLARGAAAMTRRTFVAWIAALAPANRALAATRPTVATLPPLDATLVRAVAEAVLPAELGTDGLRRAGAAFESWATGYRALAELNHGYGTGAINRTPADPRPKWSEQLAALDTQARTSSNRSFTALSVADRQVMLRAAIEASGQRGENLPDPARAPHIALAVLAHFYDSADANDLCYEKEIGKNRCRPLAAQATQPVSLGRRRS
jgi:hypothetical protein